MSEYIEQIITATNCSREVATKLLSYMRPAIAKEIIEEGATTLFIDYVCKVSVNFIQQKDGTLHIENFVTASKKKISNFYRNQTPPDNTGLIGKRVCFLISSMRSNEYNNNKSIDFVGAPITEAQARQLIPNLSTKESNEKSTIPANKNNSSVKIQNIN